MRVGRVRWSPAKSTPVMVGVPQNILRWTVPLRSERVSKQMTDTTGEENIMTQQHSTALRTALAYFEKWTRKDLDAAMSYIAEGIVCDAPAGRIEGAAAYRQFMGPFTEILLDANLIAAFGDEQTAVVVYDTTTVPVPSAPAAECVTVEDGKIVYSRFIFDRAPFAAARGAAATSAAAPAAASAQEE
jgi:ketosteroid isomerase-like protein